jgi:hypothetical protein
MLERQKKKKRKKEIDFEQKKGPKTIHDKLVVEPHLEKPFN